jgi:hypothetical protein
MARDGCLGKQGGCSRPGSTVDGERRRQARGTERRASWRRRRSATRKCSGTCSQGDAAARSLGPGVFPRPLCFYSDANHRVLWRPPRGVSSSIGRVLATARSHVPDRSWRDVVAVKIYPMKRRAADISRDAMALPAEARAALASRLRESVDRQSEASRRQFVRARRRALKRLRDGLDLQWAPAASRDEVHRR